MSLKLNPGFKLDDIRLAREHGRTLCAQLWMATDLSGQKVAARLADDAEVQIAFREQSGFFDRVIAAQPFEGTARILSAAPFGELPYSVEEWYENSKTLKQMLGEVSPLPADAATSYFTQLVRAVMHLHTAGIPHGLIRPENILILDDGTVRLAGLGWGRLASSLLRRGVLTEEKEGPGALDYFAPEQREEGGSGFAPPADIYSLGVVLYEMVTGTVPRPDTAPSQLNPDASSYVDRVFAKATAKSPAHRFSEMGEILRALRPGDTSSAPGELLRDTISQARVPKVASAQVTAFAPPAMVRATGGKVTLPVPRLSESVDPGEGPTAEVGDFAISAHLVTAQSYACFLRETRPKDLARLLRLDEFCTIIVEGSDVVPRRGMGRFPANQVSYFGALRYCDWLKEKLSLDFRLPTLAEWQVAAGALDGRTYAWGNEPPTAEIACYHRRWHDLGFHVMIPVEALSGGASPCGALQMCGSLCEWTSDTAALYGSEFATTVEQAANSETNGSSMNGLGGFAPDQLQVVCGGSWFASAEELRRDRVALLPGIYRRVTVGFRVAGPVEAAEAFGPGRLPEELTATQS